MGDEKKTIKEEIQGYRANDAMRTAHEYDDWTAAQDAKEEACLKKHGAHAQPLKIGDTDCPRCGAFVDIRRA